ncbi:hypothetical protein ACFL5V_07665 [Fibrobacterota bacterium]
MKTILCLSFFGLVLSACLLEQKPARIQADAAKAVCTDCHATDHTLSTGAHGPHLLSDVRELGECGLCHPDNEVEHSPIDSVTLFRDTQGYATTTVCDSCHANNPALAKTLWNQPVELWKNDTGHCIICHTVENTLDTAHALHLNNTELSLDACTDCHPDNLGKHSPVDYIVTFVDSQNLTATGTCDSCHGNGADQAKTYWKDSVAGSWKHDPGFCRGCHDNSSIINGRAASNTLMFSSRSGHGYAGPYSQTRHGANGPGYACQVCHDPEAPGHLDAVSGDARLRMANSGSELCQDCHLPGQTVEGILGYKAVSQASRHATEVTGNYGDSGTYSYECSACHDPHGTANLAMIKDTIDGGLGGGPYAVVFLDSLQFDPTGTPPDSAGGVDGVCDVCHAPGKEPHAATSKGSNHRPGEACWNCHMHAISWDTASTYLDDYWIHPPGEVSNRIDTLFIGVAESAWLTAGISGNLEVRYEMGRATTWTSTDTLVFTVDNTGQVTGVSQGSGLLIAAYGSFADSVTILVVP